MKRIVTPGFDEWLVLEETADGQPFTVEHSIPAMRGSFVEWAFNLGLATRQFRVALRDALPAWIRRHVPTPRIWWAPLD